MILITGGLGYLGARIANYLIHSEKKVLLGIRSGANNIPDTLKDCEVCIVDLEDQENLNRACNGVDTVIHLAGMNAKDCSLDPEKAILINGIGTLNLLNAAKLAKVKNFIYFSTVHVYGPTLAGFYSEDSQTNPVHPYSISNQIAENYVLSTSDNSDLNCTIFRLSNAVGSPLNKEVNCWSLVMNDLCKSIASIGTLELNSSKKSRRDFISISEVCRVILFFLDNKISSKSCEIYNLSSGVSISLEELAYLVAARAKVFFGRESEIKFNYIEDSTLSLNLDISNKKLKEMGIELSPSIIDDVDDLHKCCSQWFNK
mgnify:FL=1|tara:strand:- start:4222 stop:5166 length:945 start_codon:yes stop_codon:yes gene_type:complete